MRLRRNISYSMLLIIKGSITGLIVTFLCFIILALLMKFTDLEEDVIPMANQFIRIASIALAGASTARSSQAKGWLYGALTGIFYMVWALVISKLLGIAIVFNSVLISNFVLGFIAGAAGGIIGINLGKKRNFLNFRL